MNKKTLAIVFISIIAILSLAMYFNSRDHKILEQTFVIDAVYFQNDGYVEISFHDKSNQTQHIALEMLGMSESFHKEYSSSYFVEKVPLLSPPHYGWASIPVTLVVKHKELGTIGIKTEIHPFGKPKPPVIFSKF